MKICVTKHSCEVLSQNIRVSAFCKTFVSQKICAAFVVEEQTLMHAKQTEPKHVGSDILTKNQTGKRETAWIVTMSRMPSTVAQMMLLHATLMGQQSHMFAQFVITS